MRNINKVLLLIVLFSTIICNSALFAADAAQYGTPFSGVPDPRDVSIYQVSVGQYSSSRNLQGVINGLDNIKALGVNVIYLMPTYPVGVSGSPYSITDFGGVDPKIGTLTDLRNLVDGAHARGMAVILDWVSYETAADHPWVTSHPEYYKKDANGNMVHPFPDCTALDTSNPTVANMMIQYMRDWVFKANIDGFRCDWADYSEPSYWTNIINSLRSITSHKLLMFAEGSNEGSSSGCSTCGNNQPGYHYAQGFDLIFGESFYWNFMKKCYLNGESAKNVDGITTGEYVGASSTQLVARYMSNHDEYGSDGSPFNWMGGKKQVLSSFVVAAYMRGVPFIYNGLEVGNTSALPYPWNTGLINWTQDLSVLTSIKQILAFRNSSDAIRRGTPTSYTTDNVVAFTKTSAAQTAFVAVNIRNSNQTFTLPAGIANTTMYDGFSNSSVALGTTITLAPYEYRAFVNSVVKVTSVALSPTSASISGTGTQQLTATILPSNATNKSVAYTSSNTSVATVNSSTGLVAGVAPGTATITVTTNDGAKTATCAITVTSVAVTGVTVSPSTASVYKGSTTQLSATVAPANATNKSVTWSSSNTAIATVNASGLVTGVAVGSATITAKTTDGAKTATSTITVQAVPQFTVYFQKPAAWGTGIKVYYWSAIPTGSIADATWPGVNMTLTNGWYTYTFTGATSINLIFNDGTSQSADLSRTKNGWYADGVWYDSQPSGIAVTGVSVTPTTASIVKGGTTQLTATVAPSNATNKAVTWSSNNSAVATVSSTGLVTAVNAGTATITVTTTDGAKTASASITVTAPVVVGNYFAIKNRWKGSYLFDAGASVSYGASIANNNYLWEKVSIDATYFWLRNLGTGEYVHIENQTGSVQCTSATLDWWSAQWSSDYIDGTWTRIRNRWQTGSIVHVENQTGSAQYSGAQDGWYSAQWQLVATSPLKSFDMSTASPMVDDLIQINNDLIQFNNSQAGNDASLILYNISGQVVRAQDKISESSYKLDVPAGIYVISVQQSGKQQVKKIIIH